MDVSSTTTSSPVSGSAGRENLNSESSSALDQGCWVSVAEKRYPALPTDGTPYRYSRDYIRTQGEWNDWPVSTRLKQQWLYALCDEGGGRNVKYEVYAQREGVWWVQADPDCTVTVLESAYNKVPSAAAS